MAHQHSSRLSEDLGKRMEFINCNSTSVGFEADSSNLGAGLRSICRALALSAVTTTRIYSSFLERIKCLNNSLQQQTYCNLNLFRNNTLLRFTALETLSAPTFAPFLRSG
jgi:hypothetical protein